MEHRREIDGLRALAVMPVILFHAGFEPFAGGFVGVDVFFVISGYLITGIILSELAAGTFSLADFYERRVRRILPALFLVMLVCIPFAWFWLLPGDMRDFAASLAAVPVFASNILFWRQSVYFDAGTELEPLLHTWSLAVEEQYYALFPLALLLAWRLGRRRVLALLSIAALLSLGLAQWGSAAKPDAAFYLLPTRAWELAIGALLAFHATAGRRSALPRWAGELGGALGLALLLYAVFAFDEATPFPGVHALVPTLGAALLILCASRDTAVGGLLGSRVLVGIGLLSYSAYLWHQPLFAFARHRSLLPPGELVFGALAVASLGLAYLSWRFVEQPFRSRATVSRKRVYMLAGVASVFFVGFGLFGVLTQGSFHARPQLEKVVGLDARMRINHGLGPDCEGGYTESPRCRTGEQPEVLVWGDSYAMHLVPGLRSSKEGLQLVQKTVSMCGPFLDIAPVTGRYVRAWAEKCMQFNDRVFAFLRDSPGIQYVVMSSPFRQYVGADATVLTRDGRIVPGHEVAFEAMRGTLERIRQLGKTPVVFSPTPGNGHDIGRCLMRATLFEVPYTACDVDAADSASRQARVHEFLRQVQTVAEVVWLPEGMCSQGVCRAARDGVFMYRDDGHLSHEGSAYLGRRMGFHGRLVAAHAGATQVAERSRRELQTGRNTAPAPYPQAAQPRSASSRNSRSWRAPAAGRAASWPRNSTRRILPLMVLGRSENSSRRTIL